MIARRALLVAALLAAGCGRPALPRADALPQALGEWRRTAFADKPPADAPGPIPPGSVKSARTASYGGPGKVEVTLYELTSPAAALDAVQRWRPAPGAVFFYREEFFVVVEYRDADRKAVNAFVRDLDRRLTLPK